MAVKYLAFAASVFLMAALLGGCGTKLSEESVTTTTVFTENSTTVSAPITGEPTVDCMRTTPTGWIPGGTSATRSTSTSSSGSTTSSSAVTTTTTTAPTVHTLTPVAASSYYGLSKLKSLPNGTGMVAVYQKLVQAVSNCQTVIPLDETLTAEEITTAFYYYRADYPQHFWCDGKIGYAVSQRSNKVVHITLQYTMTGEKLQRAQTDFYNTVVALLEVAATGNDEYERELLLHDALANSITYQDGENAHNAYGALVEGNAVCEGYARAFQYLLYQAGIQCLIAEGSSINPSTGQSENHAWNVVRIGGQYYHVDLTWDDTDNADTPVMYPYFNLTTAQICEDHTVRQEACYPLPTCTATAANFHVKNGTRLTTYNVDSVAALLKDKTGGVHVYCVDGSQAFVEWFQSNYKAVVRAMGITRGYSYNLLYTGNEVVVRITVK